MSIFKSELESGKSIFQIYEDLAQTAGIIRKRGEYLKNMNQTAKWYERTIASTLQYRADRTAISGILSDTTRQTNRLRIGEFYMMYYPVPKTADDLEFYDRFPFILCTNFNQKYIEGINFHYFPPKLRKEIFMGLIRNRTNATLKENTRVVINMDRILKDQSIENAVIGYRKYLIKRIRSRVIHIDAPDWFTALYLPFERFRKAGPRQVWAETRREEGAV